jgi:hypothetical protein
MQATVEWLDQLPRTGLVYAVHFLGGGVVAGNPEAGSSTNRDLETGNAMQGLVEVVEDIEESSRRSCTPGPRAPRHPAAQPQLKKEEEESRSAAFRYSHTGTTSAVHGRG